MEVETDVRISQVLEVHEQSRFTTRFVEMMQIFLWECFDPVFLKKKVAKRVHDIYSKERADWLLEIVTKFCCGEQESDSKQITFVLFMKAIEAITEGIPEEDIIPDLVYQMCDPEGKGLVSIGEVQDRVIHSGYYLEDEDIPCLTENITKIFHKYDKDEYEILSKNEFVTAMSIEVGQNSGEDGWNELHHALTCGRLILIIIIAMANFALRKNGQTEAAYLTTPNLTYSNPVSTDEEHVPDELTDDEPKAGSSKDTANTMVQTENSTDQSEKRMDQAELRTNQSEMMTDQSQEPSAGASSQSEQGTSSRKRKRRSSSLKRFKRRGRKWVAYVTEIAQKRYGPDTDPLLSS